jgi:predicted lactoylglutathione lyase
MATQIYVNLPVKDVQKSIAFFLKLGFKFNPQFTDKKAAGMIIGTDSFVMLVEEPYFKTFTIKPVADAKKATEVIVSVSVESRVKVDEMVRAALAAGGKKSSDGKDYGWMYQQGFQDLDEHLWEVLAIDMSKMPKEMSERQDGFEKL